MMSEFDHHSHPVNKLLVGAVVLFAILAAVLGLFLLTGRVAAPEPSPEPEPVPTQEAEVIVVTATPAPATQTATAVPPTNTAVPATVTATSTPVSQQPDNPLHNTSWSLLNFGEGIGLLPGTNISALFASNGLTGFAGCNTYSAAYVTAADQISISGIASTRKLCEEAIMLQETQYLAALENTLTFSLAANALYLDFGTGVLNYGPFGTPPDLIEIPAGGENSASGQVGPGDMLTYLVPATAGQLLTVQVTSPENTAVLSIQGNSDGVVYAQNVTAWTMAVPVTQEYVLRVTTNGEETVDFVISGSLQ
jgi:heat shock protein HslJ